MGQLTGSDLSRAAALLLPGCQRPRRFVCLPEENKKVAYLLAFGPPKKLVGCSVCVAGMQDRRRASRAGHWDKQKVPGHTSQSKRTTLSHFLLMICALNLFHRRSDAAALPCHCFKTSLYHSLHTHPSQRKQQHCLHSRAAAAIDSSALAHSVQQSDYHHTIDLLQQYVGAGAGPAWGAGSW